MRRPGVEGAGEHHVHGGVLGGLVQGDIGGIVLVAGHQAQGTVPGRIGTEGAQQARDYTAAAAMAKMVATENAQRVIDMALQMHGGMGVRVGSKIESLYRDIRALRIYEGATEVQKLIIARETLKAT